MEEVPISVLEGRVKPCKGYTTSVNLVPSKAWKPGSQMAFRRSQNARPGLEDGHWQKYGTGRKADKRAWNDLELKAVMLKRQYQASRGC